MTDLEKAIEAEVERRVAEALRTRSLPQTLTVEEAAKALRVGRSTVYAMIRSGELHPARNPRRVLIPASEVERLNSASAAAEKVSA